MVTTTFSFSVGAVLLSIAIACSPYCKRWPWFYPWGSPSRLSNVLGLAAGCILLIYYKGLLNQDIPASTLAFNQGLFCDVLLPFVIFNAGFCFKRVMFFANMGAILSYGLLGTLVTFFFISVGVSSAFQIMNFDKLYDEGPSLRDTLTLGATFCATDSIAILQILSQEEYPMVFSLAFGEGVVNDAVAVVLAGAVSELGTEGVSIGSIGFLIGAILYLVFFSTIVGIVFGFITAYLVRKLFTIPRQQTPSYEVALMVVMAFMSYYVSTLFGLSGILTIFVCGVIDSHYTWYNLNDLAKIVSRQFALMMSNLCELYMFILVGMDSMDPVMWSGAHTDHVIALTVVLLTLVVLSRAACIYSISALSNWLRIRTMNVTTSCQHILVWGGIVRGSVTMAIAYKTLRRGENDAGLEFEDYSDSTSPTMRHGLHATLLAASVTATQITIILVGMFTEPVLRHLLEIDDNSKKMYQFIPANERELMANGDADEAQGIEQEMSTLDLQQSTPLVGGGTNTMDEGEDVECFCITVKRHRQLGAQLRKYDRNVLQPIFGGRYASLPQQPLQGGLGVAASGPLDMW